LSRKARRRLEQSRKKDLLKAELRLNEAEAALLAKERTIAAQQYEDEMNCDVSRMQIQNTGRYWKPSTRRSQEAA